MAVICLRWGSAAERDQAIADLRAFRAAMPTDRRIRGTKAQQKARGRYLGGKVPFGFVLVKRGADGALEPDDGQQAAIATVRQMRGEGAPLRTIQSALADAGHRLSLDAVHRIAREAPQP